MNMGYYQNRVNPSTNVIFTAGKHTIVAGGGYSYTQLNITNNRTGHAQAVISGFDNFLQGTVKSSSVSGVSTPPRAALTMRIGTTSPMSSAAQGSRTSGRLLPTSASLLVFVMTITAA